MKNSLGSKGLSMSQAQSISNLCHQRAQMIDTIINTVNNAKKQLSFEGQVYIMQDMKPIPGNILDLLKEKSLLHAVQGFLMENIKAKEQMLNSLDDRRPEYPEPPKRPNLLELADHITPIVEESWGWEQLTLSEIIDYKHAEAYAAHLGQYIHKGGTLDRLRKELSTLQPIEWITVENNRKIPVVVEVCYDIKTLTEYHESIAKLHREFEQKVNYYKAKVKNLVSAENSRINSENAVKIAELKGLNNHALENYSKLLQDYDSTKLVITKKFESELDKERQIISSYRIIIPEIYKGVIDSFMNSIFTE